MDGWMNLTLICPQGLGGPVCMMLELVGMSGIALLTCAPLLSSFLSPRQVDRTSQSRELKMRVTALAVKSTAAGPVAMLQGCTESSKMPLHAFSPWSLSHLIFVRT